MASSVAQSCPTLCNPMHCSPPVSSVLGDSPDKNTRVHSVQFSCSVMFNSFRPHRLYIAHQASLSITNSQSLLKLMPIESVMPSNHLILCHLLLLLLSVFPVSGSFPMSLHIRWPKYWNCSFSIGPSNEYSGLISFRIDWFDLLAVQGTFKSLLQHHNLKGSILQL